eukprot:7796912-Alexandrium_andersonii.AAC.1
MSARWPPRGSVEAPIHLTSAVPRVLLASLIMSGLDLPSPEDERDHGLVAPPALVPAEAAPPLGGTAPVVVPAAVLESAAAAWIKLERGEALTEGEESAVTTWMALKGHGTPRPQGSAPSSSLTGATSAV